MSIVIINFLCRILQCVRQLVYYSNTLQGNSSGPEPVRDPCQEGRGETGHNIGPELCTIIERNYIPRVRKASEG